MFHEVTSHDTHECNAVKGNPKLQEAYAADIRRQRAEINLLEHGNEQEEFMFDYFNCVQHMLVMPPATQTRADLW